MATPKPTLIVEVELAGSGAGWTAITTDVLQAAGVEIEHGIQGNGLADRVASTGTAKFSLDNTTGNSGAKLGYYSVFHANKRSGWALGIGCRIRMTDPATSTTYTRFLGRIDTIDPMPGLRGPRSVAVTAVDWMDEAASWNLTPAIGPQVSKTDDQILTAIIAEMPHPPLSTVFVTGVDTYPYALDSSSTTKQSALAEFQKIMMSGFGRLYLLSDGTLVCQTRHSRILRQFSGADQAFTDSSLNELEMASARDQVINRAFVTIHQKLVDTDPSVVFHADAPFFIAVGQTVTVSGEYSNPLTTERFGAIAVQSPVAFRDYEANINATGDGADKTGFMSFVLTAGASGVQLDITNVSGVGNTSGGAWLYSLQLLGRAVHDQGELVLMDLGAGSTSITDIGERAASIDMPYQSNPDVGLGAAVNIVTQYTSGRPQPSSLTVKGKTSALLTEILNRDISDLITIQETVSGLTGADLSVTFDKDFFINAERLTLNASGYLDATYLLATTRTDGALGWILGTDTLGTSTTPSIF